MGNDADTEEIAVSVKEIQHFLIFTLDKITTQPPNRPLPI